MRCQRYANDGTARVIARVLQDAVTTLMLKSFMPVRLMLIATSLSQPFIVPQAFEDAGIIARHDFRDGRARYEPLPDNHHDHLIDLKTGKVIEFQSERIEALQEEIARELGYQLVDHRLELYAVPLERKDKS